MNNVQSQVVNTQFLTIQLYEFTKKKFYLLTDKFGLNPILIFQTQFSQYILGSNRHYDQHWN